MTTALLIAWPIVGWVLGALFIYMFEEQEHAFVDGPDRGWLMLMFVAFAPVACFVVVVALIADLFERSVRWIHK